MRDEVARYLRAVAEGGPLPPLPPDLPPPVQEFLGDIRDAAIAVKDNPQAIMTTALSAMTTALSAALDHRA